MRRNCAACCYAAAIVVAALLRGSGLSVAAQPVSGISQTRDGQLHYHADARGHRVPDFSTCGYAKNDKPIPDAPVRMVVSPVQGDSTSRIQRALDHIATLAPDTNGVRGAVLLLKGRHEVLGSLLITNSGVVLRGQGMGEEGTALVAAGLDRRTLIRVAGQARLSIRTNASWRVTDEHVPVGAARFRLHDASELKAGDTIRLTRSSTAAWIDMLAAAELGGGVGGGWKPGTRDINWDRVVESVNGSLVTLDAPITTAIERDFTPARVAAVSQPDCITNVGIENLALESTYDRANPKDEDHAWCAITMENTADAWVRQVTFRHFAGSAVALYETCRRITVQDCLSLAPVSEWGGYRRHTFFTMGQQTLFLRCYAEQGRHDFSAGHCAAGPNAFVQCEAREALGDSGPIESWASGVLYDNVNIDGHALTLGYRPGNNAGIGWSAANCVLWNCSASVIRCWNPPGAQNWSFGSWASFEGDGIWRSSNEFMKPDTLFAAQLRDRLGAEAAERLQLLPRPPAASSNPTLSQAQELAAASHQPAPQLKDYIADASARAPIPSAPGDAMDVDDPSFPSGPGRPKPKAGTSRNRLVTTNGWLTVNGKLLIGGSEAVTWWRGSVRPEEAAQSGPTLTRFVPGRLGAGFTDDLREVADSLAARGHAALDYHYGLWYDRRRDDHQRVRRMDGDVLPPFYEQPFARSGQGTAWDGLSLYDLAKFNPWYWSRLKAFADLCGERGLVLFHHNYFQHHLLEAGAHWADFPWRSANNLNGTDFPEPPPYAGDKRIFMAELFYDVTHPVRRKLHEGYIRQCLGNFAGSANVIQFTSAEFTGPLHFVEFWLDTVQAWRTAGSGSPTAPQPLIALSATKDVQDAILRDAPRSALVDVIDFRYWWRTDEGEFAPPGGKNLAPRQLERPWRGRHPKDAHLAQMAAEYRAKFPAKPLLCGFDSAAWAWVCAGGSMPRLPKSTEAKLLAAIPRMRPWFEASQGGRWALREAGQQMLVYTGGNRELDLSDETGWFAVYSADTRTGSVGASGSVKAGGKVQLPDTGVIWLKKEG